MSSTGMRTRSQRMSAARRGAQAIGAPRRRRSTARSCACVAARRRCGDGGVTCSKVSDKLEALKSLIPASDGGEIVKADQLFEQTADYIVRLRTQVTILQTLIEFYGSCETERESVVS